MSRPSIYALLLACPLGAAIIAHGGRTPLEWNLCVAAIGLLSLIYWFRGRPGTLAPAPERHVMVLAFLAPAYVAFQMLPLPLPLVRLLSPRRAEIVDGLGAVMDRPWFAPLSIEPASTATALTIVLACVLCFLLVRELTWLSLRRGSWVTILPLVALGVFEGGLALWEAWSGIEVDGTYWSRNHLAGMLEMVLPLSLVYVAFARRTDHDGRPASSARTMLRAIVFRAALPMLAVVIIFAGVVAGASKMGNVAALFGVLAMGLVVALTRLSGIARWAFMAALPVVAVAGFVLLVNQDVLIRLSGLFDTADGVTGEGRLPIWADSLRLLAAYPLFGSGLGTYLTGFLAFQTTGLASHWTHAHNDYLELATDLGAIGFAVFGALMLAVAARAFRITRQARRSGADLAALGCLGAFAAIGLHSIVDFNLYIPANALLLAWITGIAAGVPPPGVPPRQGGGPVAWLSWAERSRSQPRQIRLATITIACIALAMAARGLIAAAAPPIAEDQPPLTLDQRLGAVRSSPASPYMWLDLAEAFAASGQPDKARASATNAIALGSGVPPVIRRAATVLDDIGDRRQAVTLVARSLQQHDDDPGEALDWFVERGIPSEDVLAGLSSDRRALQAYLKFLMLPGTCGQSTAAWRQLITLHRPDIQLVRDYMSFLNNECVRPAAADDVWADYARESSPEYRVSEWVFNGGFEQEPLGVPFDWQWAARRGGVDTSLDEGQKFAGARSLRMVFKGPSATGYDGASQNVAVTPGVYRFSAAVKTLGLQSAFGIRFRISSVRGSRLEVLTEQAAGTTDWHIVTTDVTVPEGTTMLRVQVLRRTGPGAEKEEPLDATVWVDAVTLSRVGSSGGMPIGGP